MKNVPSVKKNVGEDSARLSPLSFLYFGGIFLLKSIPLPIFWLLETLVILGKLIVGFVLLIAAGFLTAALVTPLWKKVETFDIPMMSKEIFPKACWHLRDYYQLQEPYIITKCF